MSWVNWSTVSLALYLLLLLFLMNRGGGGGGTIIIMIVGGVVRVGICFAVPPFQIDRYSPF